MKKALIITIIIIILGGTFLFFRSKNGSTTNNDSRSGFRSFFSFGTKIGPETETPGNENVSEFTPEVVQENP
ncbi:MAG: hypothetical protein KBC11_03310, partial [Candidatus Pacebacteria bacterium]|nr:hypothetical protein [Candidatus Paceibacterota bacterium]